MILVAHVVQCHLRFQNASLLKKVNKKNTFLSESDSELTSSVSGSDTDSSSSFDEKKIKKIKKIKNPAW